MRVYAEQVVLLRERPERELAQTILDLLDALEKIAAGPRPDGTYNLSREACEQIAKEALSWGR